MDKSELEPCPFCGSQHSLDLIDNPNGHTRLVRCLCCMAEGPVPHMSLGEHTDAAAITAWNTRAPDERALIVAWMMDPDRCPFGKSPMYYAQAIERGDHLL